MGELVRVNNYFKPKYNKCRTFTFELLINIKPFTGSEHYFKGTCSCSGMNELREIFFLVAKVACLEARNIKWFESK